MKISSYYFISLKRTKSSDFPTCLHLVAGSSQNLSHNKAPFDVLKGEAL